MDAIGYTFKNPQLLTDALTHASMYDGQPDAPRPGERLEFLGDAVLSLILGDYVYAHFPNQREGYLTKARAVLEQKNMLATLARELNLHTHLHLGKAEASKSELTDAVLEDAFEALVAAIYLDSGQNLALTARTVLKWYGNIEARLQAHLPTENPKGQLQEAVQAKLGAGHIAYTLEDTQGPGHALAFTCHVHIAGELSGTGTGPSKRAAEEAAAEEALQGWKPDNPPAHKH